MSSVYACGLLFIFVCLFVFCVSDKTYEPVTTVKIEKDILWVCGGVCVGVCVCVLGRNKIPFLYLIDMLFLLP